MTESQYKILIVDDNPENLRVLSAMLKNEGHEVRVAKNGKQALASIEGAEPDLLLLDGHMPEMDGFAVCRQLRSDPRYERMPIIFLSALTDTFNKLQGFEAGADDYMTKPFDVEEVKIKVKTHLKLRASLLELDRLKTELAGKDKEIEQLKAQLGSST